MIQSDEFSRSFRIGLISAWLIPPITGELGMTFLGFWELQDAVSSLVRFTGIYVVAFSVIAYVIFKRHIIDRISALSEDQHELSPSDIKRLKAFPWIFWGLLTLYCAAGPPTVLLSNAVFDGKTYTFVDYVISAFGVIPFFLIAAFPLFFYLTDLLGRYLAPRGIVVAVAPVWLKVTVLGLCVPFMIDTVLLTYYYDRTGFLSLETLALWFLLLVAAAIGTLIAIRSFRQGMRSLERPLAGNSAFDNQTYPVPSSLDEFGVLARGWADLLAARDRAELRAKECDWLIQSIIDNTDAVICIKDTEGRYVMINSHFEKVFGLAEDAVKGKTDYDIFSEEIADSFRQHDLEVIRDEKSLEFQETVLQKGGAHTYISLKFPLYDPAGALYGVCSVSTDITERKRLEEALREKDARLRELQTDLIHVSRLNDLGHLASALAHELNQPLTAIMNYVQASRRKMEAGGDRASDKVYSMMDKAVDQADRAGAIIRRLRDFIEKGETHRSEEDINQVVEEASSLAFIGLGEKGVVVGLELDADLPQILIDKVQIQQVILNLVRNSVEAMAESKSRQVTITTSLAEAESIKVAISDTGPGLAEEVLNRLFEPFVSTRAEGMGMGLSISRSIVDAHGGRLEATSNPGGGATFCFTLPIKPPMDEIHEE